MMMVVWQHQLHYWHLHIRRVYLGLGWVSFLRERGRVSGLLIWQLPKKRVQALGAGLQKHLKRWVESSPDPVPALEALEECREYI